MADRLPPPVAVAGCESTHWQAIARRWSQVGSPLRPAPEDVEIFQGIVDEWAATHGSPRVLLFGVTPEIYQMAWPAGTDFAAVDRSEAMIGGVWPGPAEAVTCASWLEVPHEDASRDMMFCDGGLHLLPWPHDQRALAREVARLVSRGGLFVLRLFAPPSEHETPESVLADLLAGNIRDLNVLKLRLGMSLQEAHGRGVKLAKVWQTLATAAPDFPSLARRIAWPVEHLLAINSYKDSSDEYCFVTSEQAIETFCGEGNFEVVRIAYPEIVLGERCPILILRRT